jgi:hypothetical protein
MLCVYWSKIEIVGKHVPYMGKAVLSVAYTYIFPYLNEF